MVVESGEANAYTVVLSPNPESAWYSVTCPALPGAVSQGAGRDEALRNIKEAMAGWLLAGAETGVGPLPETPE